MKKNILKRAVLGLLLMCGGATTAGAQTDLGSILGSVLGGTTSSDGDLVSTLTSVFSSSKQAQAKSIVGTWTYSEPAIMFTSNNILAQAASKLAANKLENKLQSYLTQYGIKPGAMTMTFKDDGTFTETISGKTTSGTWTINDSKLELTISGVKALSITTQLDGKNLMFVTDATKLLNLFKSVGAKSTNSNIQTVTSLMKSINGMQAGITLRKQ